MVGDSLPDGWSWKILDQVKHPGGRSIVSGPFGSNIGMRFFVNLGVPVIRGNNLKNNMTRFIDDGFVFLTEEKAKEFRNCEAYPNDLIFTAAGTIGQVGIIPEKANFSRYIISNKQLRARLDESLVLPLFAYYWFSSPEMVAYIEQRNTGSTIPLINLSILRQLPLPLPPLQEQKRIVEFLSNIDDKIELNIRMNHTLEEMATVIFKSWFVDFDPVVAMSEGLKPFGMSEEIARLFPTTFDDSQMGPIPNGWLVSSLQHLFSNKSKVVLTGPFGSNLHAYDYREKGVPIILVNHVKNGYIADDGLPMVGEHKFPEMDRYRLKIGDIVFTRVGAVGRSAYVHDRQAGWLISGQMLRVRLPEKSNLISRYLAQVYLQSEFIDMVEAFALGTTRPSLNTEILLSFNFLVPPYNVQKAYTNLLETFDNKIQKNLAENRALLTLRDTLLPKLLSGEIRL